MAIVFNSTLNTSYIILDYSTPQPINGRKYYRLSMTQSHHLPMDPLLQPTTMSIPPELPISWIPTYNRRMALIPDGSFADTIWSVLRGSALAQLVAPIPKPSLHSTILKWNTPGRNGDPEVINLTNPEFHALQTLPPVFQFKKILIIDAYLVVKISSRFLALFKEHTRSRINQFGLSYFNGGPPYIIIARVKTANDRATAPNLKRALEEAATALRQNFASTHGTTGIWNFNHISLSEIPCNIIQNINLVNIHSKYTYTYTAAAL